jgi:hypothetical protein
MGIPPFDPVIVTYSHKKASAERKKYISGYVLFFPEVPKKI